MAFLQGCTAPQRSTSTVDPRNQAPRQTTQTTPPQSRTLPPQSLPAPQPQPLPQSQAQPQPDWEKMNPVQACDVLASHPDDPEAYAAGVSNLRLEHDKVIKACEAAIKLDKKSPRLNFQLARGYLSANRLEEAIEQLLSAAKQGHGGALGFLGDIYLDGGPGIEPNPSIAKGLYARSAESGFEPAKKLLAEFEDYTEKVAAAERELKASPKSTTATASGPKTIPGYANAFTSTYQGPKLTDSKGSCTPESVFAPQMRRTGYMMAVSALQVFINSKAHQTWLTSTHDIEGDSVIGEELDEFLDINTDRNTIARAEALMKEKGMGDARIGQETNQMQNFLYLLLKKRFDAIVESKNLLSASRFGIPATFGAAMLTFLAADYFIKEKNKKNIFLAGLLALAVNFHLDNTKEFQYSWEKQERFAQQLIWRKRHH